MKSSLLLFVILLGSAANASTVSDRENHDFCLDAISKLSKAAYHRGMANVVLRMDQTTENRNLAKSMREKHEALLKDAKFYCSRNWVEGER